MQGADERESGTGGTGEDKPDPPPSKGTLIKAGGPKAVYSPACSIPSSGWAGASLPRPAESQGCVMQGWRYAQ